MGVERTIYCDGPDCGDEHDGGQPCHVTTATPPPHIPSGFIETRQRENGEDFVQYFCGWDCVMRYAAARPVPEVIRFDDLGGEV